MNYVIAAYGLTVVIVSVYGWNLWRERKRLEADLAEREGPESNRG